MLIFHHNDLDGRCAAAVMAQDGRGHEFVELDYKDRVPTEKCDGRVVAVVDFSFKPEVMAEVRQRATNVIWCDHHATAKDYGYDDLSGHRDFTEKGLSGCECTWIYCRGTSPMPATLGLIGDYDSWRMKMTPCSLYFYEGMKLEDTPPNSPIWRMLLQPNISPSVPSCRNQARTPIFGRIIEAGKTVIKYRDNYCTDMCMSYGYNTEIDGYKAYAANIKFGSKGFGVRMGEYPLCISYIHDGKQFTVSLYSEVVDVSAIAKKHGGGGHKGAAGFVCKQLPFKPISANLFCVIN